ncbi:MAG: hypothetical protein LBS93_02175, partial [Synergistaceae bacterium]|nr:hypothetical protein [Synergistaceae bacterium]
MKEHDLKASIALFFALFVFAIFSVIIYTSVQQINDAASVIASRLGYPIVKRAAAFVDGDAFENLARTLDENDPFYDEIRLKLLALKEETQVLYLYTMAPYTETVHRFIIDGGRPGDDGFSPLGAKEDITDYTSAYVRTYETKSMQSGEMNLQSTWGWVISAYAPILNSAGDMVGIIGCDFEAESVYQAIYARILQQIVFVVVFIAIGSILYFSLLKAITRQNQKLIDMNKAFQAASESKSMFLARMSHEIRTPMNAIIGMNELAIRDYGHPEALEYLHDIRQAGATLLSIINDILDFSKIESGHIEITAARYETASLLNDALAIIRVRLGDKPVELLADIDPSIPAFMTGDEVRVRQILLNILSNAQKYTDEGLIKFTARWEKIGDETVNLLFSVEDSGIGIKREDIGHLFGDFSRVDLKRNKNIQGSGLGLLITRLLCRAMGGDVTVTSEYGQGSVFTATIRQNCADYVPMGHIEGRVFSRAEAGGVRFTAPDFRVLIVDDNAANLKVAAGLLAPYMMKVDTCLSGEESVALVNTNG